MLRIARSALKLVPVAQEASSLNAFRCMTVSGLSGFKEHEKVNEDIYFTKEDQRNLAKLLKKVQSQSDVADQHAAAGVRAAELSSLKQIVEKYKVSSDDMEKLMAWKHTQY